MTILRIETSEDYCEGAGYCAKICPEVFQVSSATGKVVLLKITVDDDELAEKVMRAEATCPARAITVWKEGEK